MDALFDIGDIVRKKPRGHKMIVTFIHTPWGTGIYDAIYQSLKRQKPQCHFFYACKDFKTGKQKDGVFCEEDLEKVVI
jgi:uncharacterized protein YodC (DUF2158 family)